jgi:hypothetical protein
MSNERKVAKNVIGFKPAGSYIVVELLEDKEVLGTGLTLSGNTKLEAPQAYVLGMGPSLDTSKFGVKERRRPDRDYLRRVSCRSRSGRASGRRASST